MARRMCHGFGAAIVLAAVASAPFPAQGFLDFVDTTATSPAFRSFAVTASRDGRNVYSTGYFGLSANGPDRGSRSPPTQRGHLEMMPVPA